MAERRPIKERTTAWAKYLARFAAQSGLSPNQISILSVVFSLIGAICFIKAWYLQAGLCIGCRLICNMLDGMVAVEYAKKSPSGDIFNELPDRLSDTASLVGAGWAAAWPQLGLWSAILAILTAYIRILSQTAGAPADFGGPMAKQQRMKLLIVACVACIIWPQHHQNILSRILVIILIGSAVTCWRRASQAIHFLETQSQQT